MTPNLEFVVWDFANNSDRRNTDNADAETLERWFRDLAILADGWWVCPETVGKQGKDEIFIPLAEWKEILGKRKSR